MGAKDPSGVERSEEREERGTERKKMEGRPPSGLIKSITSSLLDLARDSPARSLSLSPSSLVPVPLASR